MPAHRQQGNAGRIDCSSGQPFRDHAKIGELPEWGDSLAASEAEADSRERVLGLLGQAATDLRGKLGESLASIQKFDKPLEQVTTSSLEALKAYTEADKISNEKSDVESLPFLKRAIELDPSFAAAYLDLAISYANLGQDNLSRENVKKAYALGTGEPAREICNRDAIPPVRNGRSRKGSSGVRALHPRFSATLAFTVLSLFCTRSWACTRRRQPSTAKNWRLIRITRPLTPIWPRITRS